MAVGLLAQNREILADRLPIHLARCNLMHRIICFYTPPRATLFTNATTANQTSALLAAILCTR